ncbi:MAG: hypothetical protein F6K39_46855 [Okeania sp. SIO3B3]|nr:hypothetical protein [Okeania sp. SIO3B3]
MGLTNQSSVAVAGTTILGIVVVPGVTITMPTTSTTIGVFGLSRLSLVPSTLHWQNW